MPTTFAAATAAIAIAAFAHTMIVGTRRRRRDLAVLKALGFTSRQLRTTILVQAAVLAGVALAVGVVSGIALGRVGWAALSETIGSPLSARTPLGLVAAALPAVGIAVVVGVSWWPGHDAVRSRPATTLRTD